MLKKYNGTREEFQIESRFSEEVNKLTVGTVQFVLARD